MTNQRTTTLLLILVFLISVYVLIELGLQREKNKPQVKIEAPIIQNFFQELKESFVDEPGQTLNEAPVQELLEYQNRDSARLATESEPGKKKRLVEAAKKFLHEFSECSADGSHCGVNTEAWEDYFSMGMPPLHEALVRALNMISVTETEIEKDILFQLFKTPSFMVSYTAASLALKQASDYENQIEVLNQSRNLKRQAKAEFLVEYASQDRVDEAFVEELSLAVSDQVDSYTRSVVVSQMDKMNLNEDQFRFVSFQACQGVRVIDEEDRRAKLISVLHRKSSELGFQLSKNQLCSLPVESAED